MGSVCVHMHMCVRVSGTVRGFCSDRGMTSCASGVTTGCLGNVLALKLGDVSTCDTKVGGGWVSGVGLGPGAVF